jgi:hypothetical protein
VSLNLAWRQLELTDWPSLRADGGPATDVRSALWLMLTTDDLRAGNAAYQRIENLIVAQGHLSQCAPPVVSVVMAAVAEEGVPPANLSAVLDLLCLIVMGYSAPSESALGNDDLREQCHHEARKGYWALMRVFRSRDPFSAWSIAGEVLSMLDERHFARFSADES